MENISEILELHRKWLNNEEGGERADLRGAYLSDADLHDSDLRGVFLQGAEMRRVDLQGSDLRGAKMQGAFLLGAKMRRAYMRGTDLRGADLRDADLQDAILWGAKLQGAILHEANLHGTDMRGTDLQGADLTNTDLQGARNIPFIPLSCPDSGSFIGWKKCGKYIVKLLIFNESKRTSATTTKCRCDKAAVLEIQNIDGSESDIKQICSNYDKTFYYTVGKIAQVDNFCEDRFSECAPGIHFFITRQEAVEYIN